VREKKKRKKNLINRNFTWCKCSREVMKMKMIAFLLLSTLELNRYEKKARKKFHVFISLPILPVACDNHQRIITTIYIERTLLPKPIISSNFFNAHRFVFFPFRDRWFSLNMIDLRRKTFFLLYTSLFIVDNDEFWIKARPFSFHPLDF
jgi:hypothetical protein